MKAMDNETLTTGHAQTLEMLAYICIKLGISPEEMVEVTVGQDELIKDWISKFSDEGVKLCMKKLLNSMEERK